MKFTPKTAREIAEDGLLPKGRYDAEVKTAEDAVSTKGNPMIKIHMRVFRPSGGEAHIYDYLMEAAAYKLRNFCYAVGLGTCYEEGTLRAEDLPRRSCEIELAIDDKNKDYPPKNVIKDYIIPYDVVKKEAPPKKQATAEDLNTDGDDIPF